MNDDQASAVIDAITNLAVTVRDEGVDAVRVAVNEVLAAAGGDVGAALTIAAALIRVDEPVDTWWTVDQPPAPRPAVRCGSHSSFNGHKQRGEPIDDECRQAERDYQRERMRRRRAVGDQDRAVA